LLGNGGFGGIFGGGGGSDNDAPETQAPVQETQAPVQETQAPAPETQVPAPETQAPVSSAPVSSAPVSIPVSPPDPVGSAPTTPSPTTPSPTTSSPTTSSPTTPSPTAPPPTKAPTAPPTNAPTATLTATPVDSEPAPFTICAPDDSWTLNIWDGNDPVKTDLITDDPDSPAWTISFEALAGLEFCGVPFEYSGAFEGTAESEISTTYIGFTDQIRQLAGIRVQTYGDLRNEGNVGIGVVAWHYDGTDQGEYIQCGDGSWCSFGPDKYINALGIQGYQL